MIYDVSTFDVGKEFYFDNTIFKICVISGQRCLMNTANISIIPIVSPMYCDIDEFVYDAEWTPAIEEEYQQITFDDLEGD